MKMYRVDIMTSDEQYVYVAIADSEEIAQAQALQKHVDLEHPSPDLATQDEADRLERAGRMREVGHMLLRSHDSLTVTPLDETCVQIYGPGA